MAVCGWRGYGAALGSHRRPGEGRDPGVWVCSREDDNNEGNYGHGGHCDRKQRDDGEPAQLGRLGFVNAFQCVDTFLEIARLPVPGWFPQKDPEYFHQSRNHPPCYWSSSNTGEQFPWK